MAGVPRSSLLTSAVEDGDIQEVRKVLGEEEDPAERSSLVKTRSPGSGRTLFHTACAMGRADIVRVLLANLAENDRVGVLGATRALDRQRLTALHISVRQRSRECLEALLEPFTELPESDGDGTAAFLRAVDADGLTPLHMAVTCNFPEAVEPLLQCDPGLFKLAVEGSRGQTALVLAIEKQAIGVLRPLAEHLPRAAEAEEEREQQEKAKAEMATEEEEEEKKEPLGKELEKDIRLTKQVAKRAMKVAVRQSKTDALEELTQCLHLRGAFGECWREAWEAALIEALARDSEEMVAVLAKAAPEVVSVDFLKQASQKKPFCALLWALGEHVGLCVSPPETDNARPSPTPWAPMVHPVRTPVVIPCQRAEEEGFVQLTDTQKQSLKRTPLYACWWGRASGCTAHLLPPHLLSLEWPLVPSQAGRQQVFKLMDGPLPEVLKLLALNPQPEVFRAPFAVGVQAKAWTQVRGFYYLDIFLNTTHIVLAVALTRKPQKDDLVARPNYLLGLLVGVSLLVLKDLLDELFQLGKLGWDYLKLSENWCDAVRFCVEFLAILFLWLNSTSTVPLALISAWVFWTWVHFLTDLRGLYGFGHLAIPILEAIFDVKVLVLGCVLAVCIFGASHASYVFTGQSELYEAFKAVFFLGIMGDGESEQWNSERGDPGYEVTQVHIFVLCFIFIVPVPLFIGVLGSIYNLRAQRGSESFLRARAMLAVEYDVAALPRLLRFVRRLRQPDEEDKKVQIVLSVAEDA